MTLKQKTRVLAHEGLKVVGNAVAYEFARAEAAYAAGRRVPSYQEALCMSPRSLDRMMREGGVAVGRAMVAAAYGSKLKKSIAEFKAAWKGEPLKENPAQ